MLHALLGVAVGTLLRNTAAAVGAVLVWAFVVEGIVPVVTRRPEIGDWLPSGAVAPGARGAHRAGPARPAAAAALLLGYTVALVAAGAWRSTGSASPEVAASDGVPPPSGGGTPSATRHGRLT